MIAAGKFQDLGKRTLTAVLLLAALAGLLELGGRWLLAAHWLVVFPLMLWETVALTRRWWPYRSVAQRIAMVGVLSLVLGSYFGAVTWLLSGDGAGPSADIYCVVVLFIAIIDMLAYFGGRLIGGRKLAPSISPGKTVSGALVAVLGFGGMMVVLGAWASSSTNARVWDGLFIGAFGILLAVLAQAGDLLESYFKRLCGVKDSGRLLLGHGGVLDRLDGHLLVMPAVCAFMIWMSLHWQWAQE
jgi:phosphatidate cytidylyltransferase